MKTLQSEHTMQRKKNPCIWQQAGVVHHKECRNDYECQICRFDKTMGRVALENRNILKKGGSPKGKRGRIVSWKDRFRELSTWKRPCLHHMKGRINFRACTNDYCCSDCDFDQYFYDHYTVHAVVRPVDVLDVAGFRVPQGYYLHPGHAWMKLEEGSTVRIGIDDFILRVLGPERIEAPLVGKEVRRDSPDIILTRESSIAKVMSPVSGVVTDINPRLRETGGIFGEDPYSDGWIMRVHSNDLRRDIRHLMIGNESKETLTREVDRLYGVIEEISGPMATDGGYLCDDIYGALPQLGWDRLTRLFLKT